MLAITSFTAEKTDSGDQLFAILKTTSDSFLYPVGFTAWGSSASINLTSTSAPFPTRLYGNNSTAPVHVTTDSGSPPTVAVSGYVAPSTTVTVTGYTAPSTTVTSTISAITTTTGGGALDSTNSAIRVNVVAGSAAGDSTVTATITGITTSGGGGALDSTNSALRVNVVAGSAGGTEYAVDSAAPAAPSGTAFLAERDDIGSSMTPAEGDWSQLFTNQYGDLRVAEGGVPSVGNTSTSALSSGATFTGTAELNSLADVMVSAYADQPGTLYFDFGNDTANFRTFPTNGFAVSSGVHEFHTAVKGPRYFRTRYVNGSSAQTTFQLYTYYGAFRQPNAPLNQAIALDADALITRAVILGETPSSSYVNVQVTAAGNFKVSLQEGENSSATAVFVDNSSTHPLYVSDSATPVFVRGLTDSTVPVSGTVNLATSTLQDGVLTWSGTISSAATLIKAAAGKLMSYHIGNTSTSANAFVKIYNDTAVVLGTDSAIMDLFIPFGGGAVLSMPTGYNCSVGISVAAAATAGSTVHDTPPTVVATIGYV